MLAKLVIAHLWSTNLLFAFSGGRVLDHTDGLRFQALRRHIGYADSDNATNMRIQDTLCFIVNACSSRKVEDESSVGHVAATGTLDAFSFGSGVVGEDARNKFTASYLYDVGYKKVYAFPTPRKRRRLRRMGGRGSRQRGGRVGCPVVSLFKKNHLSPAGTQILALRGAGRTPVLLGLTYTFY